jgi:hypothetical protein
MINWFPWLLGLIAAFGSSNFLFHGLKSRDPMLLFFGTSFFFLGLSGVAQALGVFNQAFNQSEHTEWFIRFCVFSAHVVFYSALAVLVREVKPPFARFPYVFVGLPLLLLLAFPLASNIPVILNWIELIFQIGAILILALLLVVIGKIQKEYYKLFIPIILCTLSLLSYYVEPINDRISYLWQVLFLLGMLYFGYQFDRIIMLELKIDSQFTQNN